MTPTYGSYLLVSKFLQQSQVWSPLAAKGGVTEEEMSYHLIRAEDILRAKIDQFYRHPLNSIGLDSDGHIQWPRPVQEIIHQYAIFYLIYDRFSLAETSPIAYADILKKNADELILAIQSGGIRLQGNRFLHHSRFINGEISDTTINPNQTTPTTS